MKRRFLLILCVSFLTTTAFAGELTVQNDTDGTLVYLLVTPSRFETLSEAVSSDAVAGLFETFADRLDRVPPRGVRLLGGLPESDLVLIGYIDDPDRSDAVVVVSDVTDDRESGLVIIHLDTVLMVDEAPLRLRSWQLVSNPAPVQIDNRYGEWVRVPDLSSFRSDFRPESFTRFTTRAQRGLSMTDSLLWGRGGSRLERVKALRWEQSLFLMAASTSEMSSSLSLIMRLYPDRSRPHENEYTIEVPLGDIGGPVLLWSASSDEPEIIGDFVRTRFFVEAEIRTDRLPHDLAGLSNGSISFDVSTRLSDHGLLEEFHHTTGFVRDIPGFHGSSNR